MKGLSVGFTAVVNLYKKDPQCNSLQSPPSRTRTPPHSTGIDRRDKCNLRLTHRRSPLRRVRQCSQRSTSRLCQFHRLPRIRVTCHSCITRDPRWRCCRSSPAQSVSRTFSFPFLFALVWILPRNAPKSHCHICPGGQRQGFEEAVLRLRSG